MGTSVNNVHIRVKEGDFSRLHQTVLTALRNHMHALDFHEILVSDTLENSVAVVSDPETRWISVFPYVALNITDAISRTLSQIGPYPVLGIQVANSEVLTLKLFENGEQIDTFCDWANFKDEPREVTGDATKWVSLLPVGEGADALRAAWQPSETVDDPFQAEDILERVVDLLELDPEIVWWDEGDDSHLPVTRATRLYFAP